MKLCCTFRVATNFAGVLGLLQSSIGLGLNIFFTLFYFEVITLDGVAWNTLRTAWGEEWLAIKSLTIVACAVNLVWLIASLVLIVGHVLKKCNMIQCWVVITPVVMLYDVIALIVFLASTVDLENVNKMEEKNFTFYILDVLSLGRLNLLTIVLNSVLCYWVQKRIFQIIKEQRKDDDMNRSVSSLHAPKGEGVYFPTEMEDDPRADYDPSNKRTRGLSNGTAAPIFSIDDRNFQNEPRNLADRGKPFHRPPNSSMADDPVASRLARFEEHSDRSRQEGEKRANLVSQLHDKLPDHSDRDRFQPPPTIPRVTPPNTGNYEDPTYTDHRPRPDSPMIQPRGKVFVATPFVPKVDYTGRGPDAGVDRGGYDNPALDLSYDLPPPQTHGSRRPTGPDFNRRQSDPRRYMPGNDRGLESSTSPPSVAKLTAIVERDNSFRSLNGPPHVLRRENSNRSIQNERERGYAHNQSSRQARALPQPRRLDGYLSEEDERGYGAERRNNRNYDSDAEFDYRSRQQGYHNGRSRF